MVLCTHNFKAKAQFLTGISTFERFFLITSEITDSL